MILPKRESRWNFTIQRCPAGRRVVDAESDHHRAARGIAARIGQLSLIVDDLWHLRLHVCQRDHEHGNRCNEGVDFVLHVFPDES